MKTPLQPELMKTITGSKRLPSPPGVVIKILELDKQEQVCLSDIANVICADPVLTSKIIQYCNSPSRGLSRTVSNLNQAVISLGMRPLKMMALSFSFLNKRQTNDDTSINLDEFWVSSLARAVAAQMVCNRKGLNGDDAFLAALVGRLGHMAVMLELPEIWERFDLRLNGDVSEECASRMVDGLGTTCARISAQLLEQWNFPETICEIVANLDSNEFETEMDEALFIANEMARFAECDSVDMTALDVFRDRIGQFLNIDEEEQDAFFEAFLEGWSDFAQILSFQLPATMSLRELEHEAQSRLLKYALQVQHENETIEKEKDRLITDAFTDSLTGLSNRRAFESKSVEVFKDVIENREQIFMLVMDIDHFKVLNDSYGHQAGDHVLQVVAKTIRSCFRRDDHVFRYGGEEFVALMPRITIKLAMKISERVRNAVEHATIMFNGQPISTTISVGVSSTHAPNYCTMDELFEEADTRLYEAKNMGRNRCRFPVDIATA